MTCLSTYSIGPGEALTCERHLIGGWDGFKHSAEHAGVQWYWSEREADAHSSEPVS